MTAQGDSQSGCTSRLQTVLIASSLEKGSNPIVTTGAALARAAGARIYLVHVAPPAPVAVGLETGWLAPGAFQEKAERQRQLWDQAERLRIDPEELAGVEVICGPPHRVIVQTAQRIGAGLIVIGASEPGHRPFKLLGSTADRVVRQATCPVLVLRGELAVPPRRLLMPVDLSELSADAFRCGLSVMDQISNGEPPEIEAFYVLDFLDQLDFLQPDMPWVTTSQQVEPRAAWELARFVRENSGKSKAPVRTMVRPGDAGVEILAESERQQPDLILLGTHGHGGFDRLLLGSIASTVLQKAPCSVLMIPPVVSRERETADAVLAQGAPAWPVEQPALKET